jgi:hypothetical protein
MSDKKKIEGKVGGINKGFIEFPRTIILLVAMMIYLPGCEKYQSTNYSEADQMEVAGISDIIPVNNAESVVVNPVVSVTFKPGADQSIIKASSLSLKDGIIPVSGEMSVSGSTALFIPDEDLKIGTEYTATLITGGSGSKGESGKHEYSWKFKTGKNRNDNPVSVVSVTPPNNTKNVPLATDLTITFNQILTKPIKKTTTVELKNGTAAVAGSLSFAGSNAVFKPTAQLLSNTVYSVKVKFGKANNEDAEDDDDDDDDKNSAGYTWSFSTGAGGNDAVPPTVISVVPANNASAVATNANVSVNFSEAMNAATINSSTITLKQGTTTVAGTLTYSGTTATFTPASALAANTVFTGTVSTGVKDAAGNALAAVYSWSFTSAASVDATAPTVLSVSPLNNAATVATTSKLSVTFSEAMNTATINTTTFTLKQGTTPVAGTVTYSGTIATFTPSVALTGKTVYTGTITTGAKDASGNALAANYVWSFTTIATTTPLSFAADVVPVLSLCNACHTHPWTTSPVASTFYTNLVNAGYVNPTSPTTSKIYTKLNGGHPGSGVSATDINKILTWMNQGSANN